MNIARGKITAHCGDMRTATDFSPLIDDRLPQNPGFQQSHWVTDPLNTHQSETLVRLVAKHGHLTDDLGVKGTTGIPNSMETREQLFSDTGNSVVCHYTPKPGSWMNQIEIWFGIGMKKVIKRGNFTSTDERKTRRLEFLDSFNRTMAKPFKWTYPGQPLTSELLPLFAVCRTRLASVGRQ